MWNDNTNLWADHKPGWRVWKFSTLLPLNSTTLWVPVCLWTVHVADIPIYKGNPSTRELRPSMSLCLSSIPSRTYPWWKLSVIDTYRAHTRLQTSNKIMQILDQSEMYYVDSLICTLGYRCVIPCVSHCQMHVLPLVLGGEVQFSIKLLISCWLLIKWGRWLMKVYLGCILKYLIMVMVSEKKKIIFFPDLRLFDVRQTVVI
jgi:hypothetical protein